MIFSQPFQKADKPCIHKQNIRTYRSSVFIKFKSSLLTLIRENPTGMVIPLLFTVIQDKDRIFNGRMILIR